MKANWILAATMCGWMFAAGVASARASMQETPPQAPSQTPEEKRLVWTGRSKQADGTWKAESISPTLAKDLRKELARIQVAMDVERKFDVADRELGLLALQASRPGYAERKDLLIEIALARASLMMTRGDYASYSSALATLDWVFVHSAAGFDASNLEFGAPTTEDKQLAEAAAKDPRVVKLRAQLTSTSKTAPSAGEDKIAAIVAAAVETGTLNQTRDLGERAIPTLQQMAAKDLDSLPVSQADPLRHLVDISQSATAEFIRAHFDDGGALWKTRILRLMREGDVLRDSLFSSDNKRPFLRTPEWLPVVERLIDDPATTRESVAHANRLALHNSLTPSLQRSLVRILCGGDAGLAKLVLQTFRGTNVVESMRPVLAAALASPYPEVRTFAAEQLLLFESSPELLAAASHADPGVRVVAARALRAHMVNGNNSFTPTIGENERAALTKLAADPSPEVRAEAADSIARLVSPLSDEVYVRLANDPDPRVRVSLLRAAVSDEVRLKLAMSLSMDKDPKVLKSFDTFLIDVLLAQQGPTDMKLRYIPVIDARIRNTAGAFPWSRDGSNPVLNLLAESGEGLQTMLRWSLEDLTPYATGGLIGRIMTLTKCDQSSKPFPRPIQTAQDVGIPFTPAQFRELFVKAAQSDMARVGGLTKALASLKDAFAPQFLPMASDPKQPLQVRARALQVAAFSAKESIAPVALDVLSDKRWTALAENQTPNAISGTAYILELAPAAQILEQVLTQKLFSPEAREAFAIGYVESKALGSKDADRILALWSDGQFEGFTVINAALEQVGTRPREAQGDWLLRGLNSDNFVTKSLQVIGESRDPSYLPVLKGLLASDCPLRRFKENAVESRKEVINTLTRYFDDEAAAILLDTAGSTPYPTLRDAAFAALETIRKYRAEKGRWEELRTSKEATASAVKDLVALLDDTNPAVRAQAARGLGTLHAVEQMPRIVRLLKDSDDSVRKAANDALSVLNSPAKQD